MELPPKGLDVLPKEVVLTVARKLVASDLYNMARTCRSWSNDALDVIWGEHTVPLEALIHLLLPLKSHRQSKRHGVDPDRFFALWGYYLPEKFSDRWSLRLRSRACQVRRLLVRRALHPDSVSCINRTLTGSVLLPHLRSLEIEIDSHSQVGGHSFEWLVGTSLRSLTVRSRESEDPSPISRKVVQPLLDNTAAVAPLLHEVHLLGISGTVDISMWRSLRRLELVGRFGLHWWTEVAAKCRLLQYVSVNYLTPPDKDLGKPTRALPKRSPSRGNVESDGDGDEGSEADASEADSDTLWYSSDEEILCGSPRFFGEFLVLRELHLLSVEGAKPSNFLKAVLWRFRMPSLRILEFPDYGFEDPPWRWEGSWSPADKDDHGDEYVETEIGRVMNSLRKYSPLLEELTLVGEGEESILNWTWPLKNLRTIRIKFNREVGYFTDDDFERKLEDLPKLHVLELHDQAYPVVSGPNAHDPFQWYNNKLDNLTSVQITEESLLTLAELQPDLRELWMPLNVLWEKYVVGKYVADPSEQMDTRGLSFEHLEKLTLDPLAVNVRYGRQLADFLVKLCPKLRPEHLIVRVPCRPHATEAERKGSKKREVEVKELFKKWQALSHSAI